MLDETSDKPAPAPVEFNSSFTGLAHGYLEIAERVVRGQLGAKEAREATRALVAAIRERLPNRRSCSTFEFEHRFARAVLQFTCSYGQFPDGRLAEIFLECNRAGSDIDAVVRESAVAGSLALQFGCPLETLRGAVLRNADNSPATQLGRALDVIASEQKA